MIAHRLIIGMVVEIDIGDWQPELSFARMERDGILLLRHVFADNPYTRHAVIGVHRLGEGAPPFAGIQKAAMKGTPSDSVSNS